eukprot:c54591_g1_i1 orf=1-150(-)
MLNTFITNSCLLLYHVDFLQIVQNDRSKFCGYQQMKPVSRVGYRFSPMFP